MNKKQLKQDLKKYKNVSIEKYFQTLLMFGSLSDQENNFKESLKYYREAMDLSYLPELYHNYGLSLLQLGDEKGFEFYRYRYLGKTSVLKFPELSPMFISDINRITKNDNIIVLNEQGLGDELLFSNSIKELSLRANKVKYKVSKPLIDFFRTFFKFTNVEFFTDAFSQKEVLKYNVYANIGDMFATMKEKTDYNQDKFNLNSVKKIAISYSTNPQLQLLDNRRKIKEDVFKSLVNEFKNKIEFINFSINKEIEGIKNYKIASSYMETYERIKQEKPDLVIAVDSSFAHFTAKLNIPTIVLLKKDFTEWRWVFKDKENISNFFPSVKVENDIKIVKTIINSYLNDMKFSKCEEKP